MARTGIGSWGMILAVCVAAPIAAAAVQTSTVPATSQARTSSPSTPAPPPGSGLKNVQVLTGLFDVLPTMHVMRASLGVTCDYCHVAENGQYWRDDKATKRRAREMLRMVQEINRANFGGRQEVTCNTCHRGSPRPIAVPPIGQGLTFDTTHADVLPGGSPTPTAKQVLDAYLTAVGGRARLQAVRSREVHMTVLRSAQIQATPPQVANRGQTQAVDTYQQAPGRYAYVRALPGGALSTILLIGDAAWIRSAQSVESLKGDQVEQVRSLWGAALDMGRELDWAKRLSSARAVRRDMIDGRRPVWVVTGDGPGPAGTLERLCFDVDTGLLLRRTLLRPTMAGPDPEQTDYADYRRVDGILLPFRTTTSYLDDNHLGVTRIVASVKDNAAIDEKVFQH